jgi:hypothetical protein
MKPTPGYAAQLENTPERPTLSEIMGIMDTVTQRIEQVHTRGDERDTLESA